MREKIQEVLKEERTYRRLTVISCDYDKGVSDGWVEALEYVLGLMT